MTAWQRGQPRRDVRGCAFAGSQLQLQIYVNRRRIELRRAVLKGLPLLASQQPSLQWVSPLEASGFREYRDGDFLRALGLGRLASELAGFWPSRGPCWDALAVVDRPGKKPGVLLVEGKSYPAEVRGGGARPSAQASRERIITALACTQRWLGVPVEPGRWMGDLYQSANRLAHLYFLREQRVDAWLTNVYFLADPHRPTTKAEWARALREVDQELGLLKARSRPLGFVGKAFLPARKREELAPVGL
jgi:hypothetical protein